MRPRFFSITFPKKNFLVGPNYSFYNPKCPNVSTKNKNISTFKILTEIDIKYEKIWAFREKSHLVPSLFWRSLENLEKTTRFFQIFLQSTLIFFLNLRFVFYVTNGALHRSSWILQRSLFFSDGRSIKNNGRYIRNNDRYIVGIFSGDRFIKNNGRYIRNNDRYNVGIFSGRYIRLVFSGRYRSYRPLNFSATYILFWF